MGTLDEMAHGIVSILKSSPVPEPLGVDLWNEDHGAAAWLIRAVIDECTAAGFRKRLTCSRAECWVE
jgi:hypothetical protein